MSSAHVSIRVKESPELIFEFWEFLFAWIALIPFDIVIENVNSFRFEELAQLLILMDHISEPHFFNIWINALVSKSCIEHSQWEESEDFEAS